MVKCAACGKFLSVVGAASCNVCPGLYHRACVGLPEHGQSPNKWKCPECMAKLPKIGNVDTPIKNANISRDYVQETEKTPPNEVALDTTHASDLSFEIRLFREELQRLRKDLKDFRADMSEIRGAIAECNNRVDAMDNRLLNLEKEVKVSTSHKCNDTSKLEEAISQLKHDLNDRDQELLQADVEISNLPEMNGENPHHTVVILASKLGLELEEKDIIFAERVGKRSEPNSQAAAGGRGRRMVVRLARRNLRDLFLQSARARRGVTAEGLDLDAPARRFYVNERLTRENKQLFYKVRETAKHMQWKYSWTKRGKIYTRQGDGKLAHLIQSECDLVRVFGDIPVGLTKE